MKKIIILLIFTFSIQILSSQDFELVPYREINKWGFADSSKTVKIKPKYEAVLPFNRGYSAFKINNKWGVVNIQGQEIIKAKYDSVGNYFQGFGKFSSQGSVFITGLEVYINGKQLYIDTKEALIETEKLNVTGGASSSIDYDSKIDIFIDNGNYGIVNKRTGKKLEPIYQMITSINSDYQFLFKLNDKWGLVDNKFNEMIKNVYDTIIYCPGGFVVGNNNLYGALDHKFKEIIPIEYSMIERSKDKTGYYITNANNQVGFIDNYGKTQIEPKFSELSKYSYSTAYTYLMNGKWGYIDNDKKIFIDPKYKTISKFKNGYSLVYDEMGNYGYINEKGIEFFK